MPDAPLERLTWMGTPARPAPPGLHPAPLPGGDEHDEPGASAAIVRAVVRAILSALTKVGRVSASSLSDAVDVPLRALTRRAVSDAVRQPRPVPDHGALAAELLQPSGAPVLGGAAAAAVAQRMARKFGPLRFLARRTPAWLVAAFVPALHASVVRGADEMTLVASHLAMRTRAAGEEPDPERVRRATVQLLAGEPVQPDVEPKYGKLVVGWLNRSLKAMMPFAGGVATSDPQGLAAAAAGVAPASLRRQGALPAGPR